MDPIKRAPKANDVIRYLDTSRTPSGEWRPAIVTQVHNAEGVNLDYINSYGTATSATSVSRGGNAGNWDFVSYE